jgi:protein-S-isoprenylcysteine O-methyltransferase Ste14
MRASALEFRLRYLVHVIVFTLGFWAPWSHYLPLRGILGSHESTWLALASVPARNAWLSFDASTVCVLVLGIVLATLGAILRTWGSAYLGASIVKDGAMHDQAVVADGPYRYVRNPLYLGTWIHTLALGLLMPPTGALFTITVIAVLQARLIAGEEAFLSNPPRPAYAAYLSAVPRIVPSFTTRVPGSGVRPHWPQALLGEMYMIGVALSFAIFGWRYNAFLLTKCVLIALGVSIVARAFLPSAPVAGQMHEPATNPGN